MSEKNNNCPVCGWNAWEKWEHRYRCSCCHTEIEAENISRRASPWHPASEAPPVGVDLLVRYKWGTPLRVYVNNGRWENYSRQCGAVQWQEVAP